MVYIEYGKEHDLFEIDFKNCKVKHISLKSGVFDRLATFNSYNKKKRKKA